MLESKPAPAGLRPLQLIVTALFLGVVIFAAIAWAVGRSGTPAPPVPARVGSAFYGLVAIMVPMAMIMRHALARARSGLPENPGETAPDALLQRYTVITIMSAAMLEAPALFGVIVYMGSRDPVDLLVAAIPAGLILLVCYPSAGRWWRYVRSFDETPFGPR